MSRLSDRGVDSRKGDVARGGKDGVARKGMDTRPDEREIVQPRLGALGLLRWAWRQLTSMRTALFLLLLLAIGAVPGSIWPQRGIDAGRVADYLAAHPTSGPWLDRLGFFDVYASPWFAAIYLLLFVSLVGCVLPRSRLHWRAMRAQPPRAPRRLERLPVHGEVEVDATPDEALCAAREALRAKRFRLRGDRGTGDGAADGRPDAISAESGYLRETGNLVFHCALIVVIVAIAIGHLLGWRGDRILVTGSTFSNTVSDYDTFDPGPWVDTEHLRPFSVQVERLDVIFEERAGGAQFGAPRDFTAYTRTTDGQGSPASDQVLRVNGPLKFGGASLFLLGNGYAPVVTVRDGAGAVVYQGATPFLPQDNNYLSTGAIKVSAAAPKQLGFVGVFLPTAAPNFDQGPRSLFPDVKNPELALGIYEGELFPGGRASSVYSLNTDKMTQLKGSTGKELLLRLTPGQTVQLPGGRGSITFDSVQRWAGLSVRYDPGKLLALGGSVVALLGLVASLTIRRRRVFVRVRPATVSTGGSAEGSAAGSTASSAAGSTASSAATSPSSAAVVPVVGDVSTVSGAGRTVVSVGALAKGEDAGLAAMVEDLLRTISERTGTRP